MDGTAAKPRLLFPALRPFYDALEPLSWLLIRCAVGITLAVHGWGKISRGAEAMAPAFQKMGYQDPILLVYFLIGNTLKLPTYCLLPMKSGRPLVNADTLHDSLWFIPLIPLGTMLGAWMHHRVPEKPFAAIMYTAAGATAAMMIYKAVF